MCQGRRGLCEGGGFIKKRGGKTKIFKKGGGAGNPLQTEVILEVC